MLNSVQSLPNIILPVFIGFVSNLIGAGKMLCITSFLILCGNALCAYGIYTCNYDCLYYGRLVVGVGHTNLISPRSLILVKWFKGSSLVTCAPRSVFFFLECRAFLPPLL